MAILARSNLGNMTAIRPETGGSQAFLMMANLQNAYVTGQFTGVVSIGQIENPMDGN